MIAAEEKCLVLSEVCLLMPSRRCYIYVSEAVLCCAVVALVQLVRIQRRVPENGWTTQKVFHLLNAFVCILRCVVFALRDKVCCPWPPSSDFWWVHLGSMDHV